MEEKDSAVMKLQDMSDEEFKTHLKERFSNARYPSPSSSSSPARRQEESHVYNFDHPHRGLAVIINNEMFNVKKYPRRKGTHHDEVSLKKSLDDLGFHVEVFNDLKDTQMYKVAKAAASLYGHQDADCFVMAIFSHGEEHIDEDKNPPRKNHVLIGVDGCPVKTEEIIGCFSNKSCPLLDGKPRLFFMQTCRGREYDDGVTIQDHGNGQRTVTPNPPTVVEQSAEEIVGAIRPHILYPDSMIMFATPAGYYAWRREQSGSWFIQELCKFLDSEEIGATNLLQGLTSVCRKVALHYQSFTLTWKTNKKKNMPILEPQLLNDIFMTRHKKCS